MSQYLLCFDTSTDEIIISVARIDADDQQLHSVFERSYKAPRAANTQLLDRVDAALNQAGVARKELSAIAVGTTLGSYTGVRIGIACAKGIAQGLAIPLYGLDVVEEKLVDPNHLLDLFCEAYSTQSGDPSSVLPHYTMLSYAEEAERKEHPARYDREAQQLAAQTVQPQTYGAKSYRHLIRPLEPLVIDRNAPSAPKASLLLGIETSCDETAAAVMKGTRLLSNIVASQTQFHARFGGVVPEIASRKHSEAIVATVERAMDDAGVSLSDLSGIAVTDCPGLIGALVVGQAYAKGLAWALQIPLYGINHLEGHLYAVAIDDGTDEGLPELPSPHVALIVSGGHTALVYSARPHHYETLGETLDDAAGEAFDKVAKVLGLGYPGGPILSKLAAQGDPAAIDFPRAMLHSKDYAFSLSGLKTAVITYIRDTEARGDAVNIPNVAASFQQAVVDVQVAKAVRAVKEKGVKDFVMAGGVAANPLLRDSLISALGKQGVRVHIPPLRYCGDNAAMIVRVAVARLQAGEIVACELSADCSSSADLSTSDTATQCRNT
ncbi:MAG: tRNA (adenosine(37)-N6)-threonylcarbamoyltransferase complex transferase subunit TsaD [Coriobacteriia bacterium]|nr:tRNA (adenosine(37)-N6)-threonylcarbamoyltransferase complex transferase subunit TsaD [Coriobacteriia bacterium]MCL2536737.1 tRNA (adenosine(37)-N6)-threonylcarbamoyltransferase complex transferase subunit TsaD [Coriobacteriia bacterium]